jgi:hypothetical protein
MTGSNNNVLQCVQVTSLASIDCGAIYNSQRLNSGNAMYHTQVDGHDSADHTGDQGGKGSGLTKKQEKTLQTQPVGARQQNKNTEATTLAAKCKIVSSTL